MIYRTRGGTRLSPPACWTIFAVTMAGLTLSFAVLMGLFGP